MQAFKEVLGDNSCLGDGYLKVARVHVFAYSRDFVIAEYLCHKRHISHSFAQQ
jgi:hypothetical protein